jgi:hypothetical protein
MSVARKPRSTSTHTIDILHLKNGRDFRYVLLHIRSQRGEHDGVVVRWH